MATDISGHASAYQLWPGWKRVAMVRLPLLATPAYTALAVVRPLVAIWLASILGALATPRIVAMAKERGHRKRVVEPVATTVAKVLNKRHVANAGHRWVAIPRDFRDNERAIISIQLPPNWPGDRGEMARVTRAVAGKLAIEDLVANWELGGHRPYVEFSQPEQPPATVDLAMAMRKAEDLADYELAMGVGTRHALVTFSLALESPHLLIAGGSGAGKSVLIAWLTGQLMRRGYGVVVLDAKHISHMWLRRVPGVLYAAEDEELHEALLWLDQELLRRVRHVAAGGDPEDLVPLVAVLEEMNGATNRLRSYWRQIKEQGAPMMSPALTALGNLSAMGREVRVHIIMAGQSMTGKATAGVENRENFGGRALARATANAWKMLAPQIKPAPLKRTDPGRWHLVVGDTLKAFQVPFFDLKSDAAVAELIAWATGGEPVPDVVAMQHGLSSSTYEKLSDPWSEPMSTPTEGVSLADYVKGRPELTLAQVQKWRERFDDFPEPVGSRGRAQLYDEAQLDLFVWARVG